MTGPGLSSRAALGIPSHFEAGRSMGSDWDDRWRTGGSAEEVLDEAHLTPP